MKIDANELLMMFIVDGYKGSTGKISKKTGIAMMHYINSDQKLQDLINGSDYKGVLNHKPNQPHSK